MATLNSSNISNGNTIEPNDLLQLYDALTAGGGTTGAYNISISGSLTGSATSATTATTASSAINVVTATTSSGVYYPLIVDGAGTKPPKILSTFELSGSVLNNITASRAITASYALNATSNYLKEQHYTFIGAGPTEANFAFIAGLIKCSTGAGSTPAIPQLVGKTLGTNAWVTATIEAASATAGNVVFVKSLNTLTGVIEVVTSGGSGAENVHYHVIYIPV